MRLARGCARIPVMPPAATFAWLATPFISGALIGRSQRARTVVGGHLVICLTLGWTGVALMLWGATALTTLPGVLAFALGGPLAGLSFWVYDDPGGGTDDGGPGDDPPDDPLPPGPQWDWPGFESELARYAESLKVRPPGV
jgi:hypothetical protein